MSALVLSFTAIWTHSVRCLEKSWRTGASKTVGAARWAHSLICAVIIEFITLNSVALNLLAFYFEYAKYRRSAPSTVVFLRVSLKIRQKIFRIWKIYFNILLHLVYYIIFIFIHLIWSYCSSKQNTGPAFFEPSPTLLPKAEGFQCSSKLCLLVKCNEFR